MWLEGEAGLEGLSSQSQDRAGASSLGLALETGEQAWEQVEGQGVGTEGSSEHV